MRIVLAGLVCVCLLSGCGPKTPGTTTPTVVKIDNNVLKTIKAVTKAGVKLGLTEWAKKDAPAAKECALSLGKNLTDDLIPYIQGQGTLRSSAEIEALLQSSLFDKLPEPVKLAMMAAFAVLDYYLPIPDAQTYLKPEQIKLIEAFLTGMQEACVEFRPSKSKASAWGSSK